MIRRGHQSSKHSGVAKTRFFSENWVRSIDVDYRVWIHSSCEVADIDVGDTEEWFILSTYENACVTLRDLRKNSDCGRRVCLGIHHDVTPPPQAALLK